MPSRYLDMCFVVLTLIIPLFLKDTYDQIIYIYLRVVFLTFSSSFFNKESQRSKKSLISIKTFRIFP